MEKLALYGGEPLRKKPFPSKYIGVTFYGDEEMKELKDVIEDKSPFRFYGCGNPQKVSTLEKEVREYFGCSYALAVSSGSGALFCAIAALGVGPGDEVIIPAFGWYSDYFAITNMGALPVFSDVDENLNLDPADLQKKITSRTKVIVAIDFQGCPAKMKEILEIARVNHVRVLEDVAQAFGGSYQGVKLGTMGDIAIASFQQNKMISSGEGGILFTNDEELFVRAIRYHDLGNVRPFFMDQLKNKELAKEENMFAGLQFRMSELQGAVMLAQFRKLDMILDITRRHHAEIRAVFKQNKHFKIRYIDGDCGITLFMLFPTKQEAAKFGECLQAEGITLGASSACKNLVLQYPIKNKKLIHDSLPPFGFGFAGYETVYNPLVCCPNTDELVERNVALVVGPQYSDEDVKDIIMAIEKVDRNLYGV